MTMTVYYFAQISLYDWSIFKRKLALYGVWIPSWCLRAWPMFPHYILTLAFKNPHSSFFCISKFISCQERLVKYNLNLHPQNILQQAQFSPLSLIYTNSTITGHRKCTQKIIGALISALSLRCSLPSSPSNASLDSV